MLEFNCTATCLTEKDLMKVKKSKRLKMFLDDKTQMTGVVIQPNEKSMVYAQTSGSLLCGCMKKNRGTDNVECVFAKKSAMCSHFLHEV